MLLLGAPIYARVVPQTAEGAACNRRRQGVPGWVIAANLPKGNPQDTDVGDRLLQAWGVQSYTPPTSTGHPVLGQVGYRVIKAHVLPPLHPSKMTADQYASYGLFDPMGLGLVGSGMAKPGQILMPGQSSRSTRRVPAGAAGDSSPASPPRSAGSSPGPSGRWGTWSTTWPT